VGWRSVFFRDFFSPFFFFPLHFSPSFTQWILEVPGCPTCLLRPLTRLARFRSVFLFTFQFFFPEPRPGSIRFSLASLGSVLLLYTNPPRMCRPSVGFDVGDRLIATCGFHFPSVPFLCFFSSYWRFFLFCVYKICEGTPPFVPLRPVLISSSFLLSIYPNAFVTLSPSALRCSVWGIPLQPGPSATVAPYSSLPTEPPPFPKNPYLAGFRLGFNRNSFADASVSFVFFPPPLPTPKHGIAFGSFLLAIFPFFFFSCLPGPSFLLIFSSSVGHGVYFVSPQFSLRRFRRSRTCVIRQTPWEYNFPPYAFAPLPFLQCAFILFSQGFLKCSFAALRFFAFAAAAEVHKGRSPSPNSLPGSVHQDVFTLTFAPDFLFERFWFLNYGPFFPNKFFSGLSNSGAYFSGLVLPGQCFFSSLVQPFLEVLVFSH